MTRDELMAAVETAKIEIKTALQLVYDELNNGQQKKLLKNSNIKNLFDLYQVEYEKEENE